MKRAIPVALLALAVLVAGCSKKSSTTRVDTINDGGNTTTPKPPDNASEIVSPRRDTWPSDMVPKPAPSKTPLYRLNEVTFAVNSTNFGGEGSGVCGMAGQRIKAAPSMKVVLVGYCHKAENVGSGDNDLGLRRARKVRDCLKAQGISVDRMELTSYGNQFSTADRTEPMKMEQERRVEIWVLSE